MKLKKLILSGFKTFADRTEFEFHDGITCIVGPNGCGKSNVVDAIKWVLGERSAKSLRGGEMMDVIFNGCSTRKPAGMAEVTLVFDNSDNRLQVSLPDLNVEGGMVAITRRLFRGGQSEYLINKVTCRLRDIEELFMDTGVGTDAYSIIEQGRVELFLQASQEDRRAIFDEAAGISRYKARKKEALRKLERVEQNLVSANGVLAEVERQLRSIKIQAGKARNYRAYSEQLRSLKSLNYLAVYHKLTLRQADLQTALDDAKNKVAAAAMQISQLQTGRKATEVELADLDKTAMQLQTKLTEANGKIDNLNQRIAMLERQQQELGDAILVDTQRCEKLELQGETFAQEIAAKQAEAASMDELAGQLSTQHAAKKAQFDADETALADIQGKLKDEQNGTIDLIRKAAQFHNEIQKHQIESQNLSGRRNNLVGRAQEIAAELQGMIAERTAIKTRLEETQSVLDESKSRLQQSNQSLAEMTEKEQQLSAELSAEKQKRSGMAGRSQTLDQMQQRMEGVNQGVKRVLEARRAGRLGDIVGIIGDFIDTDVRHATMVESALAGSDQLLLTEKISQAESLTSELTETLGESGAVEILCMDRIEAFKDEFDVSKVDLISGRLIDCVKYPAEFAPVMWRLLGRTLVVASIANAIKASDIVGPGYRFVTPEGIVLEADGRVRIGSAQRASGVIARRSEIAELKLQIEQTDKKIEEFEQQLNAIRGQMKHQTELEKMLRQAIYETQVEQADAQKQMDHLTKRIAELEKQEPIVAAEVQELAGLIDTAVRAKHDAEEKHNELEQIKVQREKQIESLNAQIAATKENLDKTHQELTAIQIEIGTFDEKRKGVLSVIADRQAQTQRITEDLAATRDKIAASRQKQQESSAAIETDRTEIATLQEQKNILVTQAAEVEESRVTFRQRMEEIDRQLETHQAEHDSLSSIAQKAEVELASVKSDMQNVSSRAIDDMNMNLVELYPTYQHDDSRDWDAVEAEIKDLREKMERLGNVNDDAIAEQDELEKRQQFLSAQLQDITESRDKLIELINRINSETNEMFVRTFDSVRANFQELFRKIFGGGKADVVMVNPEDILESPIEIIAKPPGKEPQSISLLSGGEKTMTALALLFSFFKSRPSPFCLLDEVDAALDEANNVRYHTIIQEFVKMSQFIMISHNKRTMSMADVLYGVTMQERGVSKRISVRFDEIGENAESLQAAS